MKHSQEEMREILFFAFNPNCCETDEQTFETLDRLLDTKEKRSFFESDLRELIADPSESFLSKSRRYIELEGAGNDEAESIAKALFDDIWNTVTSVTSRPPPKPKPTINYD